MRNHSVLMAMHDLCFGFNIELAQLLAQARHGLFELLYIEFDRADLLTET